MFELAVPMAALVLKHMDWRAAEVRLAEPVVAISGSGSAALPVGVVGRSGVVFLTPTIEHDPCLDYEMWAEAPATDPDGAAAAEPWRRNRAACSRTFAEAATLAGGAMNAELYTRAVRRSRF